MFAVKKSYIILLSLILSFSFSVKTTILFAQEVSSWPKIFNNKLSGKLFLPDKTQLGLMMNLSNDTFIIKVNQNEYIAEDVKITNESNLKFYIYPNDKASQQLLFEGNIIDNVIMGGIVTDINNDKGHWWVKIPDELIGQSY